VTCDTGAKICSTGCGTGTWSSCTSGGTCAFDGSSNAVNVTLVYNTTNGVFNGTIQTNLCPEHAFGNYSGTQASSGPSADCTSQTFPAP